MMKIGFWESSVAWGTNLAREHPKGGQASLEQSTAYYVVKCTDPSMITNARILY